MASPWPRAATTRAPAFATTSLVCGEGKREVFRAAVPSGDNFEEKHIIIWGTFLDDSSNRPLISVVITAYNYGRFIEEAIDSVLSQDFPQDALEVVVVDDGSTDDTAERMRKYGPQVRYFPTPNRGQAAALNLGFSTARGQIISLLDGDDFFLPGKLVRVADAFQRDPALGMVYHP